MPDQDPWEEAAKNFKGQPGATAPAAGSPSGNDDWKLWTKTSQPTTTEPSMLHKVGSTVLDLLKGAGEGALHTVNSLGGMLSAVDPSEYLANKLIPGYQQHMSQANEQAQELERPTNTAQSIGRGIEQAGEFLIPGGVEEKVAGMAGQLLPRAAKLVVPAVRTGMAALDSGALNKVQGGSFGAGAAAGGIGSVAGQGLKALAPKIAEGALGIRKIDRAYGKTPGQAIIDETTGVRPGTVAGSAQAVLGGLNKELTKSVAQSQAKASLQPALGVIDRAAQKAGSQNSSQTLSQLAPMRAHLTEPLPGFSGYLSPVERGPSQMANSNVLDEFGRPIQIEKEGPILPRTISPLQSPADLLNLKRGFGNDFVHNWNPETMKGVRSTAAQTYHALDKELDKAVPAAATLNQRVSSLIPVAKRAESAELNASLPQRIAGRMGAHTGALIGAGFGGTEGYRHGGPLGAVGGTLVGLAGPELLASPTAQMIAARSLASPVTRRSIIPLLKGGALQADR